MISWRDIPYKNAYINNPAKQVLLTVWNPSRQETGITIFQYMSNSNGQGKNTDTDIAIF